MFSLGESPAPLLLSLARAPEKGHGQDPDQTQDEIPDRTRDGAAPNDVPSIPTAVTQTTVAANATTAQTNVPRSAPE